MFAVGLTAKACGTRCAQAPDRWQYFADWANHAETRVT